MYYYLCLHDNIGMSVQENKDIHDYEDVDDFFSAASVTKDIDLTYTIPQKTPPQQPISRDSDCDDYCDAVSTQPASGGYGTLLGTISNDFVAPQEVDVVESRFTVSVGGSKSKLFQGWDYYRQSPDDYVNMS